MSEIGREFSRPVRLDTIGTEPREMEIEAGPAERDALARRFDIVALEALDARATLIRRAGEVHASGSLRARFVQSCVATGVDLPADLDAPFAIVFRDAPPGDVPDAGLELSEGECDVVFFEGGAIDLGEAVAETLALAIDPYARAPNADAALKEMGVLSEEEAIAASGPFAGLAGLKGN